MQKLNTSTEDSPEYKAWRYAILVRDGFTCAFSGEKKDLDIYRIKSCAKFPELRYVVSNGITLTKSVHDMVTGNEDKFEKLFSDLVKKNTERQYSKRTGIQPQQTGKNYKPKNPRIRF